MRHEYASEQPRTMASGPSAAMSSAIEVAGLRGASVEDVEVMIGVISSRDGDLVVSLRGPDGTEVVLVEREGGSQTDFSSTTFRAGAGNAIGAERGPFRGTFRPDGDLASLRGSTAEGTWTLVVQGAARRDGDALPKWSLGLRTNVTEPSPFQIQVHFMGGLSQAQQGAFATAAARWSEVITGDLPPVMIEHTEIDDVLIEAKGAPIDGAGGVLGQAGPTFIRPTSSLPVKGIMSFDTADLDRMEADGSLEDVILHEMGHVLGFGTLWERMGLLVGQGTIDPTFLGASAMREYAALTGRSEPTRVPVANTGGAGTREGHWREAIFADELLTGFLSGPVRPLSRTSIGAFEDLGYRVDYDAADPFELPTLLRLAELGLMGDRHAADTCVILPTEPVVVPMGAMMNRLG